MRPEDQAYTPFYCEENVWHLSCRPELVGLPCHVTFISNSERTCALWRQRASPDPETPVIWDYHVILLVESEGVTQVLDLDTLAGFPLSFDDYLEATFPLGDQAPEPFRPLFRVVEAVEHRQVFTSDRSHMRHENGWIQDPPDWQPIQAPGRPMNLFRFVDMEQSFVGQVMNLSQLRTRFAGPRNSAICL